MKKLLFFILLIMIVSLVLARRDDGEEILDSTKYPSKPSGFNCEGEALEIDQKYIVVNDKKIYVEDDIDVRDTLDRIYDYHKIKTPIYVNVEIYQTGEDDFHTKKIQIVDVVPSNEENMVRDLDHLYRKAGAKISTPSKSVRSVGTKKK